MACAGEREIQLAKAIRQNKPAAVLDRMVAGRMHKVMSSGGSVLCPGTDGRLLAFCITCKAHRQAASICLLMKWLSSKHDGTGALGKSRTMRADLELPDAHSGLGTGWLLHAGRRGCLQGLHRRAEPGLNARSGWRRSACWSSCL